MTEPTRVGRGVVMAVGAYFLWGFLPLYFLLLRPAGAVEIVAWRIVLSLVFCALLLTVTRSWGRFVGAMRNRRVLTTLGLAGVLVVINWLVYVFAVLTHQIVEASLGYFINPIVTVLLGVFLLRERLRPAQWAAVGVSAVAVVVLAVGYGGLPWIALALAFSFGLYGLVKKRVGGRVDAVSGLAVETLWMTPAAIVALVVIGSTSGLTVGSNVGQSIAMLFVGVVTAIPLLLFAGAARRVPLTYIGLTQFLTPVLQFLIAVLVEHEVMPPVRWIGFTLVWIALAVLSIDLVVSSGRSRRPRPALA